MVSKKTFNPDKDLEDLTGKVVFVTGGNRGIGYYTVKHLARKGATVYLGSRSEDAGRAAVAELEKEDIGKGKVIFTWCDLGTPEIAREAGEKLLSQVERLDVFVMNGAMLADPRTKYMDDILIANHFGNLMLLQTLLPLLEQTSDKYGEARIVMLSSVAYNYSRAKDIRFKPPEDFRIDLTQEKKTSASFGYYAVSKHCQMMTHVALHARNTYPNLFFIAVEPGVVNTWSDMFFITRILKPILNFFLDSPEVGSYNSLFAAAAPQIREEREKYDGKFIVPVGELEPINTNVTLEKAQEMLETSKVCFTTEGMFPLIPREKEAKASGS